MRPVPPPLLLGHQQDIAQRANTGAEQILPFHQRNPGSKLFPAYGLRTPCRYYRVSVLAPLRIALSAMLLVQPCHRTRFFNSCKVQTRTDSCEKPGSCNVVYACIVQGQSFSGETSQILQCCHCMNREDPRLFAVLLV